MAKRQVFYSFHYDKDVWRVGQVRNMGVVDGTRELSDNEWESIWKGGNKAIANWVDKQLMMRSCVVVLVGEQTSLRPWVKYEIQKAWQMNKGVVGIRIHNLKDQYQNQSREGSNPFWGLNVNGISLYDKIRLYNPPYTFSTYVYSDIRENIEKLVDEAIVNRGKFSNG